MGLNSVAENDRRPHSVLWRRRDMPGHESCRVVRVDDGWTLEGAAVLSFEKQTCRLDYVIACDPDWVTRTARVTGWVGDRDIDILVAREADGRWKLNGRDCDDVEGCVDVDLNFSPSTNMLPIRRLELEVGASATVSAAWLRFPGFTLEPLEQTYTRIEDRLYRYESGGGSFVAQIAVDKAGLVIDYGELWARV